MERVFFAGRALVAIIAFGAWKPVRLAERIAAESVFACCESEILGNGSIRISTSLTMVLSRALGCEIMRPKEHDRN